MGVPQYVLYTVHRTRPGPNLQYKSTVRLRAGIVRGARAGKHEVHTYLVHRHSPFSTVRTSAPSGARVWKSVVPFFFFLFSFLFSFRGRGLWC